jgi:hypothetical protein
MGHFTAAVKGTVSSLLPPASLSSRLAVLDPHAPEGVKVTGNPVVSPGARVIWSVGTEKLLASVPETLGTTVMGSVVMFLRVTFSTGEGSSGQYAKPPKSTVEGVASIGAVTTVQVRLAGVESGVPVASMALTLKVWSPWLRGPG